MAKWITYQEDILRIYNSMRRKGEEFKGSEGHCMHLIESLNTKELNIVSFTKKNGDGLYKVVQIEAISDNEKDECGKYSKNKCKILLPKSFNMPVSEFVPATYEVMGKSLDSRIFLYRNGSNEHSIDSPFKNELAQQIQQLSKK